MLFCVMEKRILFHPLLISHEKLIWDTWRKLSRRWNIFSNLTKMWPKLRRNFPQKYQYGSNFDIQQVTCACHVCPVFGVFLVRPFSWVLKFPTKVCTISFPLDIWRRMNVYQTYRKSPGLFLNVICINDLRASVHGV